MELQSGTEEYNNTSNIARNLASSISDKQTGVKGTKENGAGPLAGDTALEQESRSGSRVKSVRLRAD
jgi:hypothetical protein